jgi:3',5'-cyclic AMP phosphodiesterase CpdA
VKLAHLSDPHLGPLPRPSLAELRSKRLSGLLSWEFRRSFRHRGEVLEAVLADIETWRPDHIAVTGDLANLSLAAEFVRGAAWLERLGPPERVSLVPGNHDAYVDHVWRIGWKLWAPWMSGDGGETGFPWLRRRPPLALVGLSSAVPSPWFRATGRIGDEQLRALDGLLQQIDGGELLRVVLVHHPPLPEVPRRKALLDRPHLAQILARRGADLVLSGHTHRFALGWLDGPGARIPVLVTPSASLVAPGEKQGGYLRLTFSGTRTGPLIEVERRVFDANSRRIVTGGRLRLGDTAVRAQGAEG